MTVERIRGATMRTPRGWVATAWVVGRKNDTQRIDWLVSKDRERARARVERVRDAVFNAETYRAPITADGDLL